MQPSPPPAIYGTPSPSPDQTQRDRVDASVEYDSQFADLIVDASARHDLSVRGTVLPYAGISLAYDTEAAQAGLSEVFTEDAVIPALGLRLPLGSGQYGELFAQGGYSFGFQGQRSFPETRWGFDYSRDYGASFATALPHTQLNGSLVTYSAFAGNLIGSADVYHDARISPGFRALLGAGVSFDSHRAYGNNYAEAFAGFLVPLSRELDLQFAGVQGEYLSRGVGVPSPPWYSTFRITLTHAYPS